MNKIIALKINQITPKKLYEQTKRNIVADFKGSRRLGFLMVMDEYKERYIELLDIMKHKKESPSMIKVMSEFIAGEFFYFVEYMNSLKDKK